MSVDQTTIKAALQKAADACMHADGVSPNDLDGPEYERRSAAAVAAFLRALPGVIVFEWLKEGRSAGMGTAADVAAMVETANAK